jgi:hypothetical protein
MLPHFRYVCNLYLSPSTYWHQVKFFHCWRKYFLLVRYIFVHLLILCRMHILQNLGRGISWIWIIKQHKINQFSLGAFVEKTTTNLWGSILLYSWPKTGISRIPGRNATTPFTGIGVIYTTLQINRQCYTPIYVTDVQLTRENLNFQFPHFI